MSDHLVLAGDFAEPSLEQWQAEVLKVLNRKRPPGTELTADKAMGRLRTTTVDGLVIEPLYTAGEPRPLGAPGQMPFTRGRVPHTGDAWAWDARALHENPDPQATNQAILEDLAKGATSVWVRVGADALAPGDLAAALAGVMPELCQVSVSAVEEQQEAAAALAAFWRTSGKPAECVGNLGIDPIGAAARTGEAAGLGGVAAWVRTTLAEFPKARAVAVDGLAYDDAGATDVDQVAFCVATGIEYLRTLAAEGIEPADAFGQIVFRVSASADQFLTIARLRALRTLWARVGEVLDVPETERGAMQHAVTSRRMITRDDPWVNLLRGTIATFAAAVGGADIITTLPYDTAQGLPSSFSRRLARNTQVIAAEESNIGRVADPAGGSYYVEALTGDLAAKAWAVVQQIEAAGGMSQALQSGLVAERIEAGNAERDRRLATRKQPITGVSMFPLADEQPLVGLTPRPPAPVRGGLQPRRDSEVFEAIRDRVQAAGRPAIFLACLGARRDFGPREQFTSNLVQVGGFAHPMSEGGTAAEIAAQAAASGAQMVILCSSAKVYAGSALEVARAVKAAGVASVWIAGRRSETGDEAAAAEVIDGEIFDGMDVVSFLNATAEKLGA